MDEKQLHRYIFKRFKAQGLSVNVEAVKAVSSVLQQEHDVEQSLSDILDAINKRIEKREVKSSLIDVEVISSVVFELSTTVDDIRETSLQLLDAYSSPKLTFDEKLKAFKLDPKPTYRLHGTAESRAQMFRERLMLAQQRLLRSGLFTMRGISSSANKTGETYELATIESLLGSQGSKILFGMITQPEEDVWYLEDFNSTVRLDLSHATAPDQLVTECSQVIVEGEYIDGIFRVKLLAFPRAEVRDATLKSTGVTDIFGNGSSTQQMALALEMELKALDTMFVIISDVQIDKPQVLEKLQQVFQGFEDCGICPIFVLMGSFVSTSATVAGGREAVAAAFDQLADTIASCPYIAENARFLIIPGNRDPGLSKALPRRPIPEMFTNSLKEKVRHIAFASNPCRMRFFTQELVFFREDILRTMQQHSVLPLASTSLGVDTDETEADAADVGHQVAKAIITQAHLWPLPAVAKPIYWELDYPMRLTPLPHLLVLGDSTEQFHHEIFECQAVNPGSFANDYSFIVYRPATKEVELSRVPDS